MCFRYILTATEAKDDMKYMLPKLRASTKVLAKNWEQKAKDEESMRRDEDQG